MVFGLLELILQLHRNGNWVYSEIIWGIWEQVKYRTVNNIRK